MVILESINYHSALKISRVLWEGDALCLLVLRPARGCVLTIDGIPQESETACWLIPTSQMGVY
jgi:hypothetical protein